MTNLFEFVMKSLFEKTIEYDFVSIWNVSNKMVNDCNGKFVFGRTALIMAKWLLRMLSIIRSNLKRMEMETSQGKVC